MFYFAKQMSKESVYSKLYSTFAITNNLAMAIFSLLHFKNGQNSTQVYEYIYINMYTSVFRIHIHRILIRIQPKISIRIQIQKGLESGSGS